VNVIGWESSLKIIRSLGGLLGDMTAYKWAPWWTQSDLHASNHGVIKILPTAWEVALPLTWHPLPTFLVSASIKTCAISPKLPTTRPTAGRITLDY